MKVKYGQRTESAEIRELLGTNEGLTGKIWKRKTMLIGSNNVQ